MTTYSRLIWPPLVFPTPVFTGKIGPAQISPVWPKMPFATGTNISKIGPAQVSPVWPKMPTPVAASTRVTWTPATAPATPNTTSGNNTLVLVSPSNYAVVSTTKKATDAFFKIISPGAGTGQ